MAFVLLGTGMAGDKGVRLSVDASSGDLKLEIVTATETKDVVRLRADGSGLGRVTLTGAEAADLGVAIDAANKIATT